MLTKLEIENFKSIHKESIDLGRVNVFIGENGCGKTNILEALGMASAVIDGKAKNQELSFKGIRVTKPSITFSSFLGKRINKSININCTLSTQEKPLYFKIKNDNETINSEWYDENLKWKSSIGIAKEKLIQSIDEDIDFDLPELKYLIKQIRKDAKLNKEDAKDFLKILMFKVTSQNVENSLAEKDSVKYIKSFENFKIFSLSTRILRGIGGADHNIPGIYGESLDVLINNFSKEEMEELEQYASMISWLDKIIIDEEDVLKLEGHKLNLSQSKLYFRDKFMQKKNNVFSAENANEGILHALFYLALFISKDTPKLFAIDNVETALNPYLGRVLIEKLIKLAKKHDKQILITTHNPSILDGINLHDDEQRLFAVERNFKGHTTVERIQIKPDKKVNGQRLKLSELWMRNYLGAIPQYL